MLSSGEHGFCAVNALHTMLVSGPPELVKRLWRQLVATCIAFGVRSTENRRFERALELLKRAGTLLSRCVGARRCAPVPSYASLRIYWNSCLFHGGGDLDFGITLDRRQSQN